MKETPKLLAGVAGIGVFVVLTAVLSRLESARPADGTRLRVEPAEAPETGTDGAAVAALGAVPEPAEAVGRVALGSASTASGETFVQPEAGRVGVVLLRWPDAAPIASTRVRIFGSPGPALADYETSPRGRVDLPQELARERIDLYVEIEGFESVNQRVGPFADERRLPRVSMRPTKGWYGRVLTFEGEDAAKVAVSGWWIEAARPYVGTKHTYEPKVRDGGGDGDALVGGPRDELVALAGRFVASRGLVSATGGTNEEGYYYVEPLGAEVRGQLTLAAQVGESYSSDVLRLSLPSERPELPDLVLHRPVAAYGTVVDELGDPLAGVAVLPQLAQGWSVDLEPVRTDEEGRFELAPPAEPLVVTAEKVGYRMVPTGITKAESLDGLWKELVAIAPPGWRGGGLKAFESKRSHVPRTRSFVAVDALRVEARIVMAALPAVRVEVVDAEELEKEHRVPIEEARVDVRYGGLDAQELRVLTNRDGRASFASADLEWQPVVVAIDAVGYHPQVFALEPGNANLRIELVPVSQKGEGGRDQDRVPNGLVLGPTGTVGHATIAAYRMEDRDRPGAGPAFTLEADADGGFRYDAPEDSPLTDAFYLFAFRGEGAARLAGNIGPVRQRALADADITVIDVEPAVPLPLDLYHLDAGAHNRVHAEFAPFPGAQGAIEDLLRIRSTDWSALGDSVVYAPYGWRVSAYVEVALQGNVPLVDFTRAERRTQPAFQSLETAWSDWQRVSEPSVVRFAVPGSVLHFSVVAHVDFGGSVSGRPYDAPALFVAARGSQGQWVAPVDGNGWFDFCDVPAGKYDLMLYSPPDPAMGYTLDGEGQLFGLLQANCRYSRFDLMLDWVEPLDPGSIGAEYELQK